MKLNTKPQSNLRTHGGAKAKHITPEQELRRSVMSCLLWEDQFYEDGESIAGRIVSLCQIVDPSIVMNIAYEARVTYMMRHVPLLMLSAIPNANGLKLALYTIINRPDELTEYLAMLWRNGKCSIPAQSKKALAAAFQKFNKYQLAKYNRDAAITLRDVMFLVHPKPVDDEQKEAFKQIADGTLKSFNTWENKLSAGEDKKATFTQLLTDGKLGYMALLRNLRNMVDSGVDRDLVKQALLARKGASKVLPFRYLAAMNHAPSYAAEIDQAFVASMDEAGQFSGHTLILVDVSGSMCHPLSGKSDMTYRDAACALGLMFNGSKRVLSFSNNLVEVPNIRSLTMANQIAKSQPNGGTDLRRAIITANAEPHDRIIVITDEQATSAYGSSIPDPVVKDAYMINVASYKNGVAYGKWKSISGFSEGVFGWMKEVERDNY